MLKKDRKNLAIFLIVPVLIFIIGLGIIGKRDALAFITIISILITGFPVVTSLINSGSKYFTQEDEE